MRDNWKIIGDKQSEAIDNVVLDYINQVLKETLNNNDVINKKRYFLRTVNAPISFNKLKKDIRESMPILVDREFDWLWESTIVPQYKEWVNYSLETYLADYQF